MDFEHSNSGLGSMNPSEKLQCQSSGNESSQDFEFELDLYPDATHGLIQHTQKAQNQKPRLSIATCFIVVFLSLVIVIQARFLVRNHVKVLLSSNGLSRELSMDRQIYVPSTYLSYNETESNLAWDSIRPGYGVVAVSQEYVQQLGLPESLVWENDQSKRVYVIEAYHAMHCIRIIRSHYLALLHGTKWDWPLEHDMHCFDGLRQYVMCNPDDTLLWTTGHRDAGHGQKKKCQDWDALRDWTAKYTISYFDYERGHRDKTMSDFHPGDGLPAGGFS